MKSRFLYLLTFFTCVITQNIYSSEIKAFSECAHLVRKLSLAKEAMRSSRPQDAVAYLLDIFHSQTRFKISLSEHAALRIQLAEAYNAVKDFHEAISVLENLVSRFSEVENPAQHSERKILSAAHYLLGESFLGLEKFQEAESHFILAGRYVPEDVTIDGRLGNFYWIWAEYLEMEGRPSSIYLAHALESYEKALAKASPSQHEQFLEKVLKAKQRLDAKKLEQESTSSFPIL